MTQTLGRICGLGRGKPEDEVEVLAASQSAKVGLLTVYLDLAIPFYLDLTILFCLDLAILFTWTWQYFLPGWPYHQMLHPILGGKPMLHKEYSFIICTCVELGWYFKNKCYLPEHSHFIFIIRKIIWDMSWECWSLFISFETFWSFFTLFENCAENVDPFSHFKVPLARIVKKTGIETTTQVWGVPSYLTRCFSPPDYIQYHLEGQYVEESELCSMKIKSYSNVKVFLLFPFLNAFLTSPPAGLWYITVTGSFFLISLICLLDCVHWGLSLLLLRFLPFPFSSFSFFLHWHFFFSFATPSFSSFLVLPLSHICTLRPWSRMSITRHLNILEGVHGNVTCLSNTLKGVQGTCLKSHV